MALGLHSNTLLGLFQMLMLHLVMCCCSSYDDEYSPFVHFHQNTMEKLSKSTKMQMLEPFRSGVGPQTQRWKRALLKDDVDN
eukprot:12813979-Ditylum_brightwellii.AAC.1